MKKVLGLFAAAFTVLLGCAFTNSAEALSHYHCQTAEAKEKSTLIIVDSLAYDKGLTMDIRYGAEDIRMIYLGDWNKKENGSIEVRYEKLLVKDSSDKLLREQKVKFGQVLQKEGNNLKVIEPGGPDIIEGDTLHLGEYEWGNDATICTYLLEKYLEQKGLVASIKKIPSQADSITGELRNHIMELRNGPKDEGSWFEAIDQNGVVQIYYVEAEPSVIYRKDGEALVAVSISK